MSRYWRICALLALAAMLTLLAAPAALGGPHAGGAAVTVAGAGNAGAQGNGHGNGHGNGQGQGQIDGPEGPAPVTPGSGNQGGNENAGGNHDSGGGNPPAGGDGGTTPAGPSTSSVLRLSSKNRVDAPANTYYQLPVTVSISNLSAAVTVTGHFATGSTFQGSVESVTLTPENPSAVSTVGFWIPAECGDGGCPATLMWRAPGVGSSPHQFRVYVTGGEVPAGPNIPGTSDANTSDPNTSDPNTSDPGTSDPGTSDPGTSDPAPSSGTGGVQPGNTGSTGGSPEFPPQGEAAPVKMEVSVVLAPDLASSAPASCQASLQVLVTDTENTAIGGAYVTLAPLGLQTTTRADGRATFSGLAPGEYTISADADGYAAASVLTVLDEGVCTGTTQVTLPSIPVEDLFVPAPAGGAPATGRISGNICLTPGVEQVELRLSNGDVRTVASGEGFAFADLPPGSYTLTASVPGQGTPQSQTVTIGGESPLDAVMDFCFGPLATQAPLPRTGGPTWPAYGAGIALVVLGLALRRRKVVRDGDLDPTA